MIKILAVMVWPLGIAAILLTGALIARRSAETPALAPRGLPIRPYQPVGRHGAAGGPRYAGDPVLTRRLARFFLFLVLGAAVIYGVMVLAGLLVIHAGSSIDKPIFHWTVTHREHLWKSLMNRATKVGNSWTTWAAAGAAAVCLAVTWRKDRWLPPVALGSLIVMDKGLTLAINHTIRRAPPPGSGGIFPSGGSERAILFYGLIAYLLWREFSGRRATAALAAAVVAALGFNEGYSRGYLAVHWFTDILSGWFYGCLMLALFITAVRSVAGPPAAPATAPVAAASAVGAAGIMPPLPARPARAPAREVRR